MKKDLKAVAVSVSGGASPPTAWNFRKTAGQTVECLSCEVATQTEVANVDDGEALASPSAFLNASGSHFRLLVFSEAEKQCRIARYTQCSPGIFLGELEPFPTRR